MRHIRAVAIPRNSSQVKVNSEAGVVQCDRIVVSMYVCMYVCMHVCMYVSSVCMCWYVGVLLCWYVVFEHVGMCVSQLACDMYVVRRIKNRVYLRTAWASGIIAFIRRCSFQTGKQYAGVVSSHALINVGVSILAAPKFSLSQNTNSGPIPPVPTRLIFEVVGSPKTEKVKRILGALEANHWKS